MCPDNTELALGRAERALNLLARLHLSRSPQEIRKGLQRWASQFPSYSKKEVEDDGLRREMLHQYDDLLRDVHNLSTQVWTMGSIFITGALVIFGLASDPKIPPIGRAGASALSILLAWSWYFFLLAMSEVGHKKFFMRSHIEILLNLHQYAPPEPRGRARYIYGNLPFALNLVWILFLATLHGRELWWLVAVLTGVLAFASVRVVVSHLESEVLFEEEQLRKREWARACGHVSGERIGIGLAEC